MGKRVGTYDNIKPYLVNDTQTILAGDLIVLSSGKASLAAAAFADLTLLGIAINSITTTTATAADIVYVDVDPLAIVRLAYTGSGKTSLAATDIGDIFDISDARTVNLDDTTGGSCIVVAYDNDKDTVDCVIGNRLVK